MYIVRNLQKAATIIALSTFVISCGSGSNENTNQAAASSGEDTAPAASSSGSLSKDQESATVGASADDLIDSMSDVEVDLLGVRLGMTPEEAYAALRAARPNAQVSKPTYVTMSVKTPVPADTEGAYAQGIRINDRMDSVQVSFARPPLDNVVTSVERRQLLSTAQPQTSLEVYRDALLNKYGKPVEEVVAGNKAMHHFKWLFPSNGTDCYPIEELRSSTEWATSAPDLDASPERCASALVYSLAVNNAIVNDARGRLGNAGAIALEIQAHVDYQRELSEQAAKAAREAATAAPDL